ncbi:MAG TPA: GtrA family protein [Methanoregula sp.]|nr:GtrA family protein [Methanoregula sp.]
MYTLSEIRKAGFSNTFVKFCLIGVINGIVGFSLILSLMYIFNVNYLVSNLVGYIGGVTTSFILNKYVNFKSEGKLKVEFPIFVGSFLIAYAANALILYSMVELLHESKIIGLIVASTVYTVLFYLSSRFFVFIQHH